MEPAILKHMMPAGPGREPIDGGFIGAASSSATTHQPDDEIKVEPEPLQERRPDDVCLIGGPHHSTRLALPRAELQLKTSRQIGPSYSCTACVAD
jgi:hypothetical protein